MSKGAAAVLVVLVSVAGLLFSSGCGGQMNSPAGAAGVLSTIHQKSLKLAAERAMDHAGFTAEELGKTRVILDIDVLDASPDLAKVFVKNVMMERVRTSSAGVASPGEAGAKTLKCKVCLAGVDINQGSFLVWSWVNTKAEVQLLVKDDSTAAGTEKNGSGICEYKQSWVLWIGPEESLK